MSQQDVDVPVRPPKKRRALERADARWLAIWASDERLPDAERERAQAERDRRKAARPEKVVGVLIGDGGATPDQLQRLQDALLSVAPTEVHHPFCSSRVHNICRASPGAEVVVTGTVREVARAADVLIGLVSEPSMPTAKVGLWETLRYAKDRGVDVRVIWPSGEQLVGRW